MLVMVEFSRARATDTPDSGMKGAVYEGEVWIVFTIPGTQAKQPSRRTVDAEVSPIVE